MFCVAFAAKIGKLSESVVFLKLLDLTALCERTGRRLVAIAEDLGALGYGRDGRKDRAS